MKLNLVIVKVLQFVTFLFFNAVVLIYFGLLLMLALTVLWYVTRVLTFVGLPAALAMVVGVAVLGYVGLAVYRMPDLYRLMWEMGMDLIETAKTCMRRFDPLLDAARGKAAGESGS